VEKEKKKKSKREKIEGIYREEDGGWELASTQHAMLR
jgi:hypothetical protein